MSAIQDYWYSLKSPGEVLSPSLLVYPDRIEKNIDLMIRTIGNVSRLRPHIKTHKTAEIIRMQMDKGIQKFKCATVAEAELLGMCGAEDILLAMQPVGANIGRYLELVRSFPGSSFSTLVDDPLIAEAIASEAKSQDTVVALFLDLNTGMNRTGISLGEEAFQLYKKVYENPYLHAAGLHAYDGHLRDEDISARKKACDEAFSRVIELKARLETNQIEVPVIVAGGSPSFPVHAKREGVEASPGTTLLWDERYNSLFEDMEYLPAAVLFCRIVSKPADNLICLDLGHKSIAPEMGFPRVRLIGNEESEQISQSEEHLVVRMPDTTSLNTGDPFYAIPMHICPTVAKYHSLMVVEDGKITGSWKVAARNHKITI